MAPGRSRCSIRNEVDLPLPRLRGRVASEASREEASLQAHAQAAPPPLPPPQAGEGARHRSKRPMDIINVDYREKIPNNVNLTEDRRVLRALEGWHPGYLDWWQNMGPEGFQESLVYLRTAVSVDPKGWAKFDYIKMPEYRWGILLAP